MPLEPTVLGFSNRWYAGALSGALHVELPSRLKIRVITAPHFIATKIEAFRNRGNNDFFASHDLEDIVTVIDGRTSIVEEVAQSESELKSFIGAAIRGLLNEARFLDALPGYLLPDSANQQRIRMLLDRLRAFASVY
jgi:hypothetical protein